MQFRDLNAQYQKLKAEIDAGVQKVISSCKFISGPQVKQLEGELAEYVGVKHCVTCANGTDALELVLRAWGIGSGDAVFVPAFTFMSTAEVVSAVGATPVFVDIDPDTFNMDPASLEQAIEKTKSACKFIPRAIIPVDLFGQPADFDKITPLARKHGLKILEDGAQGFGGEIRGKRACSFGDAATTSFFPAKPLGCYGDGGAIFTDDDALDALLRSLCVHGKGKEKYENVRIGRNSRLDTIQAAILLPKLHALRDYEVSAVNRVAALYTEKLNSSFHCSPSPISFTSPSPISFTSPSPISFTSPSPISFTSPSTSPSTSSSTSPFTSSLVTPAVKDGFISSWAQYTIMLADATQRNAVQAKLKEKGIPAMIYYPRPLHLQKAFEYCGYKLGDLPNAEAACNRVLSLPMHPYMTDEQVDDVVSALKAAL